MANNRNWGGKRKPSPGKKLGPPVRQSIPEFQKKFRATPEEKLEFLELLTGDSRADFIRILELLRKESK
ncbi:MAG: hypothetical protein LC130_25830 [Bryobacterales bacterium]|nr:hypothetical protein [Bryobacterales bacterium]